MQISLVREHTQVIAPPRALWVPFMLGRPFGVPGDAAFQRKVMLAVLKLFERESGPVLEDYPEDAPPDARAAPEGLSCPVSFPARKREGTLVDALTDEVSQLQAWYEIARRHRGRSTLGVTGLAPAALVGYLSAWLAGDAPGPYRDDLTRGDALKQACDELRAFYYEAKSVQPGEHSVDSTQHWFWTQTAAGESLLRIKGIAAASSDASVKAISAISLVPRAVEAMLQQAK